jgi:hypothetical protein
MAGIPFCMNLPEIRNSQISVTWTFVIFVLVAIVLSLVVEFFGI